MGHTVSKSRAFFTRNDQTEFPSLARLKMKKEPANHSLNATCNKSSAWNVISPDLLNKQLDRWLFTFSMYYL